MSDALVSLLTPPGTGAIATVEVRGPRAWELARQLFTPAGKPLPESPEVNRFWFGTLGSDEVVLAVVGSMRASEPRPEGSGPASATIEIHCHGGRRVVRWVMDQFLVAGAIETSASGGRKPPESATSFTSPPAPTPIATSTARESLALLGGLTPPARLLQRAPTLRTASIILDQLNGAFATEVRRILALIEADPRGAAFELHRLAEVGNSIGRHLIEPWKVVIAGPPNVGKSSLVNALAGYQRSVVSEVAGTTRDAVSVRTAFDGWPVELIDTAGFRDAMGLEAEGIEHSRDEILDADLVLWVLDVTVTEWYLPTDALQLHVIVNKCDALRPNAGGGWEWPLVSARTGEGVLSLAAQIVSRLVPTAPAPGTAVPFTPHLADLIGDTIPALIANQPAEATRLLREALAVAESHHFASPFGLSS